MDPLQEKYDTWGADPTPENLHAVVTELQPAIDFSLRSVDGAQDRLMRTKARTLAAKAVTSYDPAAGANLKTWVGNQLMPLRRYKREVNQPVKVPERTQLDAYALFRAEQEFIEKHNREPDLDELSDAARMPVKRIEKVRRTFRRTPTQEAVGDLQVGGGADTDFATEALDYVYRDADGIDRKIIEMKTGYGGAYDPMEPKEIAMRLKLTPSQLSRRSAALTLRVQEIEQNLMDVQ